MNLIRQCIFKEVDAERDRQDILHPNQDYLSPAEWHIILSEEVGEVATEICDNIFKKTSMDNYRAELIQVAATAIRIIETHDKMNKE